jgi:hypothetical protein
MINKPSLPSSSCCQGPTPHLLSLVPAVGQSRHYLPPLSLGFSRVESGPNTALTDDGNKVSTTGSQTWTRSHFPSTAPLAPVLLIQELAHTHGRPGTNIKSARVAVIERTAQAFLRVSDDAIWFTT